MDNKKQNLISKKKNKKTKKVTRKFKIISGAILLAELLFAFRGNRLYGVLLFMITSAAILIILDKDEGSKEDDEDRENPVAKIKKSINKEIDLIRKSSKRLKYNLNSKDKLADIKKHLNDLEEKYFFIKNNYGEDRGMNTLDEIINQLQKLENNLKEINDKLLNFYVIKDENENLNEDLDFIIDQLNAHKSLNK